MLSFINSSCPRGKYFLPLPATNGELDKTCAGKMMNAVGKAMIYSAQQRVSLRSPLTRLYQVSYFSKCAFALR
jgi:hypothetical protein